MVRDGDDSRSPAGADLTVSGGAAAMADDAARGRTAGRSDGELRPGQLVGERFAIVGLLGRGGMGEVYRADDLELGTSVALKFLPDEFTGDAVRYERLRREVRVARQVSHPNVCRVFDIGEEGGRAFLIMEFIDGEDLASLLRRIGRLPEAKAIELASEICSGLAAAHEHDVVHCDLKPGNVMIDGRGHARLTDFGLAGVLHDLRDAPDALAGTPAYMSPEQLAGRPATRQSDIFSLGLVLYELFTGKPAHRATTVAELRELRTSSTPPTSPSELVKDLDAAVERAIMRCLDPDPQERPPGAFAVLASLPGRDPLRALLEAGETPSPELVAASGRRGTLSPKRALQLAAVAVVGMALTFSFYHRHALDDTVGGILAPQVLEHRAREVLAAVGYGDAPRDTAWGFDFDPDALARLTGQSQDARRELLRSEEWPVLRFWYRQSAALMAPWRTSLPGYLVGDVVTPEDPPLTDPGMTLVRLGPRGRLLEMRVVPGERAGNAAVDGAAAARLKVLLDAAGLATMSPKPAQTEGSAPTGESWTQEWSVAGSGSRGTRFEVEAAFSGARPTLFKVTGGRPPGPDGVSVRPAAGPDSRVVDLTHLVFLVVGAFFALLNVRSARWDRRGAVRLAEIVFAVCFASVVIGGHHTFAADAEARLIFSAVAYAATRALLAWVLYVAIEPFIRRSHPTSLVSWSRLLAGKLGDPAVGRDVLVGVGIAYAWFAATTAWTWARGERGITLPVDALASGDALRTAESLAGMLRGPVVAIGLSLGFLLVFVIARGLLGRAKALALPVFWIVTGLFTYGAVDVGGGPVDRLAVAAITATVWTFLAVRCGLLAFVVAVALANISVFAVVPTVDPSDFYVISTVINAGLSILLIGFGVRTSTAGAPLFGPGVAAAGA